MWLATLELQTFGQMLGSLLLEGVLPLKPELVLADPSVLLLFQQHCGIAQSNVLILLVLDELQQGEFASSRASFSQ